MLRLILALVTRRALVQIQPPLPNKSEGSGKPEPLFLLQFFSISR